MIELIYDYVRQAHVRNREEFSARLKSAVLLFKRSKKADATDTLRSRTLTQVNDTVTYAATLSRLGRVLNSDAHQYRVIRLWVPGELSRVSVGRLRGCDIVLADPSVSKTHALFETSVTGETMVTDQSKNGTFLGQTRLTLGRPQKLHAGDAVHIGSTSMVYLPPAEFYDALRELTAASD